MVTVVIAALSGIISRMVLAGLGTTLAAAGIPVEWIKPFMDFLQSLPQAVQAVVGILVLVGTFGWSLWQKKRSGALDPKA